MSFKDCISVGFKDCISTYRFWHATEEEELILWCSSHHRNHTKHHNSGIYWTDEESIEAEKNDG